MEWRFFCYIFVGSRSSLLHGECGFDSLLHSCLARAPDDRRIEGETIDFAVLSVICFFQDISGFKLLKIAMSSLREKRGDSYREEVKK